jgi:predicted nucleic acid-binding protein
MINVVLDASVAVKWAFPGEDLAAQADQLLEDYGRSKLRFIVPDIFWAEVGNVAWKGVRESRWPRSLAEQAISELVGRHLPTVLTRTLLPEALAIACDYDRTLYDSLYVALANTTNSLLITADRKLANSLAGSFPVRWLGSL